MSCSSSILLAAEVSLRKKRERDRRAQRTLRTKKNSAHQNLQTELSIYKDRVAAYEHQILELEQRIDLLCRKDTSQSVRAGTVSAFVRSWQALGGQDNSRSTSLTTAVSSSQAFLPQSNHESLKNRGNSFGNLAVLVQPATIASEFQSVCRQEIALSPEVPDGRMVPRGHKVKTRSEYQWLSNPVWAAEAPDIPNALELLYGSKHNRLADAIHHRLRMRACREPERLAYGWILYILAKWISEPTEARFFGLPNFLKPTHEQIQHEHPGCIDGLIWPTLRVNLILKQDCYDMEELGGFIACCIKVRWPWGVNFMVPNDDGAFVLKKDFYDTFMSVEGWGLTSEFMRAYPELMEGLDLETIHYQFM